MLFILAYFQGDFDPLKQRWTFYIYCRKNTPDILSVLHHFFLY